MSEIKLGEAQLTALEHAHKISAGCGWSVYDEDYIMRGLIDLGLVKGEWAGNLDQVPFPIWKITGEGLEVLKQYGKL